MNSHQVMILILIGYIIFSIDKKKESFPVPVVLVLLGIALSFAPYFTGMVITKEVIFDWFLPALLFVSAYQFPVSHLKKFSGVISALGTVGLVIISLILGMILYVISGFFVPLSFLECLLLAVILTPTDPVSVVPILKKSSNSTKVADVVEGESMLNDGTSLVLFSVVLGMIVNEKTFSFSNFITEFFFVSIGGVGVGIIFGWIVLKGLHLTTHFQYQVMVSITLAYGSFYIAEHFHFSGVLASVASGIMFSWEIGRSNKESEFRKALDGFWEVIEPSILSIVFILIGIQAPEYFSFKYWEYTILIFLLTIIVRFGVLTGILKTLSSRENSLNIREMSLITWSGIKGTMSVIFILSLRDNMNSFNDQIVTLSFGVVILSLMIQSMLIYPLTKLLRER